MFSTKRIKIDKELYERLAEAARRAGYATTDELIRDALERAAALGEDDVDQQRAEEQLRGLGYLQ
ncbi:MAG: ribbon-helix-helix protein, CopG family [Pirellulales bacterium]